MRQGAARFMPGYCGGIRLFRRFIAFFWFQFFNPLAQQIDLSLQIRDYGQQSRMQKLEFHFRDVRSRNILDKILVQQVVAELFAVFFPFFYQSGMRFFAFFVSLVELFFEFPIRQESQFLANRLAAGAEGFSINAIGENACPVLNMVGAQGLEPRTSWV